MAIPNQTKIHLAHFLAVFWLIHFLPVDALERTLRWPKYLFTQNTLLTASDYFLAHRSEPEVVCQYVKSLVDGSFIDSSSLLKSLTAS